MLNESLLITDTNAVADNKKFKCTAVNGYVAKKSQRMYAPLLHVRPNNDTIVAQQPKLLPPLQNSTVTIGSGQTLRLLCAATKNAKTSKIEWHYTPRSSSSANTPSIPLQPSNQIELKIENVTLEANDGIYNCSYAGAFQVSARTSSNSSLFSIRLVCAADIRPADI